MKYCRIRPASILFVFLVLVSSTTVAGSGKVEYQFSFGDRLVLGEGPQRVVLSIVNTTAQRVDCEIASLADSSNRGTLGSRVRFVAVPGQDGCLGGSCIIDFSPAPNTAIFASIGPFEAGETKTCVFEVSVVRPFVGTILFEGTAGPIEIANAGARPIPVFSLLATALLLVATSAIGVLRMRHFERVA